MTKNTENNDGLLARKIEYISGFMLPEPRSPAGPAT